MWSCPIFRNSDEQMTVIDVECSLLCTIDFRPMPLRAYVCAILVLTLFKFPLSLTIRFLTGSRT